MYQNLGCPRVNFKFIVGKSFTIKLLLSLHIFLNFFVNVILYIIISFLKIVLKLLGFLLV